MNRTKTVRLISNTIYAIGVAIALTLGIISIFGPNEAANPMAMIPYTYKELAFIWLAFGTVPMLLACIAVYKFNDLKNSTHKKRCFIFIFLPGFICSACTLFVVGVIIVGYINSFILRR